MVLLVGIYKRLSRDPNNINKDEFSKVTEDNVLLKRILNDTVEDDERKERKLL